MLSGRDFRNNRGTPSARQIIHIITIELPNASRVDNRLSVTAKYAQSKLNVTPYPPKTTRMIFLQPELEVAYLRDQKSPIANATVSTEKATVGLIVKANGNLRSI